MQELLDEANGLLTEGVRLRRSIHREPVLERVPGAMVSLGTRPDGFAEGTAPNAHSNRYLLQEDALATGVAMYAAVALEFLK